MSNPSEQKIEERRAQIRQKRIATVLGAYDVFSKRFKEVKENTRLANSLVVASVEDYLRDREALVSRHNITGRIQRHKIAGLMAAAIVKNRPIQLIEDDVKGARISRDNEAFAVFHGLAICAEGKSAEEILRVVKLNHFGAWLSDFIYLLHRHPSNTESFILIFETLSMTYFPENLDHLSGKS